MIPPQVMADSRITAQQAGDSGKGMGLVGAGFIVLIWILAIIIFTSIIYQLLKEKL
jgi:hypothetical protein